MDTYKVSIPKQRRAAWEVAAKLDHGRPRQNLNRPALVKDAAILRVNTVEPLLVLAGEIHGAVKLARPLEVRAVKVGVRDGNRRQPAAGLDELDRLLVQVSDAVPENVAGAGLDKERALANGELRAGEDGEDAAVGFVLLDFIGEIALHLSQGCPGLAGRGHKLARLLSHICIRHGYHGWSLADLHHTSGMFLGARQR